MIIVPLERLTITEPELNGSRGLNRAPANPSSPVVGTDIEAANAFIRVHKATPTTARNYAKEIERLILWAITIKGKPFSSLSSDDISEYMAFLKTPPDAWASDKKYPRESADWRPFVIRKETIKKGTKGVEIKTAGLSVSSRLFTLAALGSFFSWLVDYGYLLKNPMRQLRTIRKDVRNEDPVPEDEKVQRYLDEDMWAAFLAAIENMPRTPGPKLDQYERAVFLSELMYFLAPRVSELTAGRMGHFMLEGKQWWWNVVGKGSKAAKIPVPDGMIKALIRYRQFLGLTPLPTRNDHTPLLPATRAKKARSIMARQVNNILEALFIEAAAIIDARALELPRGDTVRVAEFKHKAEQLRLASAHWGRHTSITFQIRSGIDKSIVQKNARHADSRTTDKYIHEDENRWYKESQKLKRPTELSTKSVENPVNKI